MDCFRLRSLSYGGQVVALLLARLGAQVSGPIAVAAPKVAVHPSHVGVRPAKFFREQAACPLSIGPDLHVAPASDDPYARMLFADDASQDGAHR